MKPHLQNRETHQIIRNTENSFIFQWRATPSGSIYAGGLQGESTQIMFIGVSSRLGCGFSFFRMSESFISAECKTSLLFFSDSSFINRFNILFL